MAEATSPTILITGGTGFAGSHLVELLLQSESASNIHVTAYSARPSFVHTLLPAENIHTLDLRDAQATASLIQTVKPTHLYHLAAIAAVGSSFAKTVETFTTNFQLQFSLLEALREHSPTTRTLIVGSAQEYDVFANQQQAGEVTLSESAALGPANPYGISKVSQDLLALSYYYTYQLPIIRVRPFNHIGERQELGFAISDFTQQIVAIERGEQSEIKVGNLDAIRDFTDVKDIVAGYKLLLEKGSLGEVYNIGSGQGQSIRSMLEFLLEQAQVPVQVHVDQDRMRPADVASIIADTTKIQQLGWQPQHHIQQTLLRVLEYWRTKS